MSQAEGTNLVFFSADGGTGVATLGASLAALAAEDGVDTLLIDGDTERAPLTYRHATDITLGLSRWMMECSPQPMRGPSALARLRSLTVPGANALMPPDLLLATGDTRPEARVEVEGLRALLEASAASYEMTVVCLAPSPEPRAEPTATWLEGATRILLVCEAELSSLNSAMEVMERFPQRWFDRLEVVINRCDPDPGVNAAMGELVSLVPDSRQWRISEHGPELRHALNTGSFAALEVPELAEQLRPLLARSLASDPWL